MPQRIMELQKYLRAMFLLDQQSARIRGALTLSELFLQMGDPIPDTRPHPCTFNPAIYCNVPGAICSQIGCDAWINKLEPLQDDDA